MKPKTLLQWDTHRALLLRPGEESHRNIYVQVYVWILNVLCLAYVLYGQRLSTKVPIRVYEHSPKGFMGMKMHFVWAWPIKFCGHENAQRILWAQPIRFCACP